MHIVQLTLHDWMRYAGTHSIKLGPTTYAIVAEWEGEEGRSNWAGKSALMEAVPFALYGEHRKRTEDEWITVGAEEGHVELVLSNGVTIRRERKLGGSTKATVVLPSGERFAKGEADACIAEMVGMTKEDFYLLAFAKQKELAALVTMKPEPFAEVVRQWFQLGPLEAVEEEAARMMSVHSEKVQRAEAARRAAFVDAREATGNSDGVDDTLEWLSGQTTTAKSKLAEAVCDVKSTTQLLGVAKERAAACEEWHRHKAALDALEATGKEFAEAELRLGKMAALVGLREAAEKADVVRDSCGIRLHEAVGEGENLKRLVRGDFDGECPVTRMPCPCVEDVRVAGLKMRARLKKATAEKHDALRCREEAELASQLAHGQLELREKLESQVAALKRALESKSKHDEYMRANPSHEERSVVSEVVQRAEAAHLETTLQREALGQLVERLGKRDKQVRDAVAESEESRACMRRYARIREAAGRQGAQRDVSIGCMRGVESLGNALLQDAGIDLSFRVRWTVEGKKLAMMCDACGYQYQGQRDKRCPRCTTERVLHAIDRPGLEMSDRSGGAEDLVGASLRLGASAWLRRRRGIQWGTMLIDEPFGSLDERLRESFAQYLVSSLGVRFGCEQAIISAHHPDILGSMPGRIRVVAGPGGSRVEVL